VCDPRSYDSKVLTRCSKNYSFIFTGDAWNAYNDHAWSIPMEFRGSIMVYTTMLSTARFSTAKRLLCEVALAWYFLYIVDGKQNGARVAVRD
jgi:hypothetical protein